MKTPYILWDWNGTLLDDTQAGLDTFNMMLARRGKNPISLSYYRDHFAFPVKPFYAEIGFDLPHEDWNAIAREYHETYATFKPHLNRGTFSALESLKSKGIGQSIISALRQDLLEKETIAHGVAPFMEFIRGTDNLNGSSKLDRARELLTEIRRAHPTNAFAFTLIGDSLHDGEVAAALGIACIYCAEGTHSFARLSADGPTVATLPEAITLATKCFG